MASTVTSAQQSSTIYDVFMTSEEETYNLSDWGKGMVDNEYLIPTVSKV